MGSLRASTIRYKRSIPKQARNICVFLVFTVLACNWFGFINKAKVDVGGERVREHHEASFLHLWTKFASSQPVKAHDRAGFSEMGLRTRLYSHMLANSDLIDFDIFEKALWPFVSGIKQLRHQHLHFAQNAGMRKRGIVISVGNDNYIFALHFIAAIRRVHKSNLPIEIYYYGEEDLTSARRSHLTSAFQNVRTIDIAALNLFDPVSTHLSKPGFALKPFALLATNFTEVILADADSVFLLPPDAFFLNAGYQKTGTLFFYDRHHNKRGIKEVVHQFLKDQLGSAGPSDELRKTKFWTEKGIFQQESGVVVVNKSRNEVFAALLFAAWQNGGDVRDEITYRIFWGDKETFWLSFELAQFDYYFMEAQTGAIGVDVSNTSDEMCTEHPLHQLDVPLLGDLQSLNSPSGADHKQTQRLPAWFNGSLFQDKHRSTSVFLNATVWSTNGDWDFKEAEEIWCIQNFTSRRMTDHGLGTIFQALINVARDLR